MSLQARGSAAPRGLGDRAAPPASQGPHWVFGQGTSMYWVCSAPNRRGKGNLPLHF